MHYLPSEFYHCASITRVNKCLIVFEPSSGKISISTPVNCFSFIRQSTHHPFEGIEWKSLYSNSLSTASASFERRLRHLFEEIEWEASIQLLSNASASSTATASSFRSLRVVELLFISTAGCIISSKPSSRGASLHFLSIPSASFESQLESSLRKPSSGSSHSPTSRQHCSSNRVDILRMLSLQSPNSLANCIHVLAFWRRQRQSGARQGASS